MNFSKGFVFLHGAFFGLFHPLWPNWLLEGEMPITVLAKNFFLATTVSLILNVPSGKFAEKYSPKTSLQVGTSILLLSTFFSPLNSLFTSSSLSLFVIAVSIGGAFISGALQASYSHEFTLKTGNILDKDNIAKRILLERIGMITGALALIPLTLLPLPSRSSFLILPVFSIGMFYCSCFFQRKKHETKKDQTPSLKLVDLLLTKLSLGCLFLGLAFGCMQVIFWPKLQSTLAIGLAAGSIQAALSALRSTGIQIWRKSGAIELHNGLVFSMLLAGVFIFAFSHSIGFLFAALFWTLLIFSLSSHDILLEQKINSIDQNKIAINISYFFTILSIGTAASSLVISEVLEPSTEDIGLTGCICFCVAALSFKPTKPSTSS